MKMLIAGLLMIAAQIAFAQSQQIHSTEELLAIVLSSSEYRAIKAQVGSRHLQDIHFVANGLNPLVISFQFEGQNQPPCNVQAVIPVHFAAPTSVNLTCAQNAVPSPANSGSNRPTPGRNMDPGFDVQLPNTNTDPGFNMPAPNRNVDPGFNVQINR